MFSIKNYFKVKGFKYFEHPLAGVKGVRKGNSTLGYTPMTSGVSKFMYVSFWQGHCSAWGYTYEIRLHHKYKVYEIKMRTGKWASDFVWNLTLTWWAISGLFKSLYKELKKEITWVWHIWNKSNGFWEVY